MVRKANINDIEAVTAIYDCIHKMETEGLVRIGWNPSIYPVRATAEEALRRGDLFVYEQEGTIMASALHLLRIGVEDFLFQMEALVAMKLVTSFFCHIYFLIFCFRVQRYYFLSRIRTMTQGKQ